MKILLITPIHPILKKANPLPTYQTQNYWLKALKSLGHQVSVFSLQKNHLKIINYIKLKKLIPSFKPDKIFFSAGLDKLYPIKQTIFFCGVPPANISYSERKTGEQAKLIVVNDPGHLKQWQKITRTKVINLPFSAIDKNIFKPAKIKKNIDFSFIGTLFQSRQLQLLKLVKKNISIKIWGWIPPGTTLHPDLKTSYQGEAWGKKVVEIYQRSKIALNLVPGHMTDGGNLRTFEIPACKSLQIINKACPNYYQENKQIIIYKSASDLKNKLEFYLSHPQKRKIIANAGYQKTINHHTFEHRFAKLLKLL